METLLWVFLLSLAGVVFIVTLGIAGERREFKKNLDKKTEKIDLFLIRVFKVALEHVVGVEKRK